jgi:small nuclear ribonucleoprotein (snRNP)-like protein
MTDIDYGLWIGKKVFLVTKTNRKYSGIVKTFDEQHLSMNDKFNQNVIISSSEISTLEEDK